MVVAQAAPAMPRPKRKISSSFRTTFASVTTRPTISGLRVRPTPLKYATAAHSAAASGPPIMRGPQNWSTSASTSAGRPKAWNIHGAMAMVRMNAGIVSTAAHRPIHAIWLVRR